MHDYLKIMFLKRGMRYSCPLVNSRRVSADILGYHNMCVPGN